MIELKTKNSPRVNAIDLRGLTKHFDGVKAVDDFFVEIEQGEITGIIGPNGSGKTTLINLLTGILSVDNGAIAVNGIKLRKIKPYKIAFFGITRTFQNVRLFEQMTVLDNILVVLTKRNIFGSLFEQNKEYHLKKAKEVLEKVGLAGKKNELAINLSYGQRKLLEMARVLAMDNEGNEGEVCKPRLHCLHSKFSQSNIFLLDEPFAGLFPEMRKIVADIILELKQKGKTVVLIEHNIDLIRELCDYVIVMDSGRLLAEGEPVEVLAKREVVEAYLGE